jgi:ferredoxin
MGLVSVNVKRMNDMSRIEELRALKERARAIEVRFQMLNKRIGEIQDRPRTSIFKAIVDFERCVACGICADQCPEGAIVIDKTAHIDQRLCTGCGQCIDGCPQDALSLHPAWKTERGKTIGIGGQARA